MIEGTNSLVVSPTLPNKRYARFWADFCQGIIGPIPFRQASDFNGNLTSDPDAGLSGMTYNALNLLSGYTETGSVYQTTIEYSASGEKTWVTTTGGNIISDVKHYYGILIYDGITGTKNMRERIKDRAIFVLLCSLCTLGCSTAETTVLPDSGLEFQLTKNKSICNLDIYRTHSDGKTHNTIIWGGETLYIYILDNKQWIIEKEGAVPDDIAITGDETSSLVVSIRNNDEYQYTKRVFWDQQDSWNYNSTPIHSMLCVDRDGVYYKSLSNLPPDQVLFMSESERLAARRKRQIAKAKYESLSISWYEEKGRTNVIVENKQKHILDTLIWMGSIRRLGEHFYVKRDGTIGVFLNYNTVYHFGPSKLEKMSYYDFDKTYGQDASQYSQNLSEFRLYYNHITVIAPDVL